MIIDVTFDVSYIPSICNGQFQCLFNCYWVQNCTIISLSCLINRNNIAWDSWVDFLQYACSILIIIKLCHYILLSYYSKNYAGILGSGVLVTTCHCNSYKCIEVAKYTTATKVKPMRKKGHQHTRFLDRYMWNFLLDKISSSPSLYCRNICSPMW